MIRMTGACLTLLACLPVSAEADPLYENSVASNDIDFIDGRRPGLFACLTFQGTARQEMPRPDRDALFADGVMVFEAAFGDGTRIPIWVHPDVGGRNDATAPVTAIATALGHLPAFMRARLNHVVLHGGDGNFFAEDQGRFFVMFADRVATRSRNNDLEETVFHEAVHATLDIPHAGSAAWRAAQAADGDFVTAYAANNPTKEDLAETALFALALHHGTGTIPAQTADWLRATVPNRLAYLDQVFAAGAPLFPPATTKITCSG